MSWKTWACAVLLLASGCQSIGNSARINPQSVVVYAPEETAKNGKNDRAANPDSCPLTHGVYDTHDGAINLDCFRFPEDRKNHNGQTAGSFAYDLAAGAKIVQTDLVKTGKALDTQKVYRDRLESVLIIHADNVCLVEKGRLLRNQTSANFGLNFLSTALATTSTIVGGEQAKSILSGLAAVASGTQSNVNATFYQNQLTQAITKAIDTERVRLMTEMVTARAQGPDVYTVDDMIRRVNAYHQACSFEKGLQLLLNAALDTSGANAAQQSRSRSAAITQMKGYLEELEARLAARGGPNVAANALLVKERDEADAKLHGLQMAEAEMRTGGGATEGVPDATGATDGNAPDAKAGAVVP